MVLAGIELIAIPAAPMAVIIHEGIAGVSSYLIGLLLIACGLLLWFQPVQRSFFGIAAVLLSLASFVTSNFGGFVIGMLLGLVGGSLGFAWTPHRPASAEPASATGTAERPEAPPPEPEGDTSPKAPEATGKPPAAEAPADADPDARSAGSGSAGYVSGHNPRMLAFALAPAMLGGLALAPYGAPAGAPDTAPACLIPIFCPSSPTPTPTPTPTSGSPRPSADPSPSGVPSATPDPSGSVPVTRPTGSGKPGGPGRSSKSPNPKASGKIAKFSPKPTHLTPKKAPAGQSAVALQANTLDASVMTEYGLSFDGVVAMPTVKGHVKMLKFSASKVVLQDVDMTVSASGGRSTTTRAKQITFSGNVSVYTTKLHAKLFGIPLTFTPHFPPPLVLPVMRMTDVETTQNYTQADTGRISSMQLSVQ